MKTPLLLSVFAATILTAWADPDPAALQRERAALERGFDREEQKINQAQEQAMIKVHARERELRAAAEREGTAGVDVATYMMTAGAKGIDFDKIAAAKLATDEVNNQVAHQLTPDVDDTIQAQRDALNRRRTLELAKFDAKAIPTAEGSDKARDEQIQRAELNAKWQEKTDALDREERCALQKLEFEQTSKLNAIEAQIYALQQKQAWMVQKKLQEESQAGKTPDMTAYAQALSSTSPEAKPLVAKRDELKNGLQTAREELSAQYNVKRTDVQNQREDDLAKIGQ